MRTTQVRALLTAGILFRLIDGSLSAETWPSDRTAADNACLEKLRPADAIVRSTRGRENTWEILRSALGVCDRPDVDARFAARSIRLSLLLPEYSRNESEIAALLPVVDRLEKLEEPPPELVHALDDLYSATCQIRDADETLRLMLESLRLRERVFGETSLQAAMGRLHVADFYANGRCAEAAPDIDLSTEWANSAIASLSSCTDCRAALLATVAGYADTLRSLGLAPEIERFEPLFRAQKDAGQKPAPYKDRWDEALPDP